MKKYKSKKQYFIKFKLKGFVCFSNNIRNYILCTIFTMSKKYINI